MLFAPVLIRVRPSKSRLPSSVVLPYILASAVLTLLRRIPSLRRCRAWTRLRARSGRPGPLGAGLFLIVPGALARHRGGRDARRWPRVWKGNGPSGWWRTQAIAGELRSAPFEARRYLPRGWQRCRVAPRCGVTCGMSGETPGLAGQHPEVRTTSEPPKRPMRAGDLHHQAIAGENEI